MNREVIQSPDMPRPLGHYSPVVKVGDVLFLSAQTGVDQETGSIPDGGFEAARTLSINGFAESA